MEVIRDRNGSVIHTSRNLAGIRRYVSNHVIKQMAVEPIADGEGKLSMLFDDGSSYETNFASYAVLRDFVSRWRNVYGAPIRLVHLGGTVCETTVSMNIRLVE